MLFLLETREISLKQCSSRKISFSMLTQAQWLRDSIMRISAFEPHCIGNERREGIQTNSEFSRCCSVGVREKASFRYRFVFW